MLQLWSRVTYWTPCKSPVLHSPIPCDERVRSSQNLTHCIASTLLRSPRNFVELRPLIHVKRTSYAKFLKSGVFTLSYIFSHFLQLQLSHSTKQPPKANQNSAAWHYLHNVKLVIRCCYNMLSSVPPIWLVNLPNSVFKTFWSIYRVQTVLCYQVRSFSLSLLGPLWSPLIPW